uniref:Uncharacterized protein n=1 Tax=Rhinolophus ferrumequinum TaxID=59479 RepID=A0A671G288_RHIFE
MNSPTHTTPINQPKPRHPIYTGYFKPRLILHPMIRLSVKLQICTNRSPTGSSTDHLLQGNPCNYPTVCTTSKWILLTINPNHHTRAYMTNFPIMTTGYNMIYLHPSRNQPGYIRPHRR